MERKQVFDTISCNISCLSLVDYEKNVRRGTDHIVKTFGYKIMHNQHLLTDMAITCLSA